MSIRTHATPRIPRKPLRRPLRKPLRKPRRPPLRTPRDLPRGRPKRRSENGLFSRSAATAALAMAGAILLGLTLFSPAARAAPPWEPVDAILCRGTSAEGFSYEWGGECWCRSGCSPDLTNCQPGVCTPDPGYSGCPNCSHTGTYGADCSGFVSKAWQVPDPYATDACDVSRYVASSFTADHTYWNVVPMSSLEPGDAVASSTHVILVIGPRDAYGEHEVVEAKGCVYGIVRQSRSFSSSYSGARRVNLSECVCSAGDQETRNCGDCGTQQRSCEGDCLWSAWSPCEGPDPTGAEAQCAGDGLGECAQGTRLCVAGWLTCQAPSPSTEVCDGKDNDCDGEADNGSPTTLGEGLPCENRCGSGTSRCVDGQVRCVVEGDDFPAEVCDGVDNDCDGQTDEDQPAVMGAVPPPLAASVESVSQPRDLMVGVTKEVAVVVRNRGTRAWEAEEVRLVVPADATSVLEPPEGEGAPWESPRVLVSNAEAVPSGETTTLVFGVHLTSNPGGSVRETFALETDAGPIPCPAPTVELEIQVGGGRHSAGCACGMGPASNADRGAGSPPAPGGLLLWLPLALLWQRRRRCRAAARQTSTRAA